MEHHDANLRQQVRLMIRRLTCILAGIARTTSRNDVSDRVRSTFREWNDMIHCQFLLFPTVRAALSVGSLQRFPLFGREIVEDGGFSGAASLLPNGFPLGIGSVPRTQSSDLLGLGFLIGALLSAPLTIPFADTLSVPLLVDLLPW